MCFFFLVPSCYHQRRFLLTSLTGISFAELQISSMRSVSLAAFCCFTLLEMSSRTLVESSLQIGVVKCNKDKGFSPTCFLCRGCSYIQWNLLNNWLSPGSGRTTRFLWGFLNGFHTITPRRHESLLIHPGASYLFGRLCCRIAALSTLTHSEEHREPRPNLSSCWFFFFAPSVHSATLTWPSYASRLEVPHCVWETSFWE